MRGAATAEGEEQEQLTRSQSVSFLREANRIKKTVKFATTPSPPSVHFSGPETTLTNETGTNTMLVGDHEDDYEAITVAAGFPLLAPKIVEARERIYPRPPTPVFRPGVSLDAIPGIPSGNGDSSSSDCSCGSLQHSKSCSTSSTAHAAAAAARMQSGVHRPPPVKDAASPPSAAEKEFIQDGDFEEGLDRRKTTPPDLLALSNMYFDRKLNIAGSGGGRVFVSPTNRQLSESSHEIRSINRGQSSPSCVKVTTRPPTTASLPAVAATSTASNLEPTASYKPRNRKLTPLLKPSVEDARIRIGENPHRARGLHHSVNYSRKGWKTALDPLSQESPDPSPSKSPSSTATSADVILPSIPTSSLAEKTMTASVVGGGGGGLPEEVLDRRMQMT